MRWVAACLLATGCGRFSFDPLAGPKDSLPGDLARATDTVVATDAPRDAPPDALDAFVPATGCADGTREAFIAQGTFPNIAGCAASWVGTMDLRAAPTGGICGNFVTCDAAADACAVGWHICGDGGDPGELSSRASIDQCNGQPGTFVAALDHCASYPPCDYTTPLVCAPAGACSEPICCGTGCAAGQAACEGAVYTDPGTHVAGNTSNGCSALLATDVTGVLCCQ